MQDKTLEGPCVVTCGNSSSECHSKAWCSGDTTPCGMTGVSGDTTPCRMTGSDFTRGCIPRSAGPTSPALSKSHVDTLAFSTEVWSLSLGTEGYLAQKETPPPIGPYSRPMPRALWWSSGGGAVSYERGTPVEGVERPRESGRW